MRVRYSEINKNLNVKSDIFFLKNGDLWFFLSPQLKSRYFGGFLFFNNYALRFLDDINFFAEIKEADILSPGEVILYFSQNQAYLNLTSNSLEIVFSDWQNLEITFDIKEIFKNEPFKRKIEIKKISSCCLIVEEFLEGNGMIKILLDADSPLEIKNEWIEKEMNFDKKRNSPPYSWYVFNGVSGKIRELKIKIINPELKNRNFVRISNFESKSLLNFLFQRINSLILDNYLPAGFSWFYENWYRDELLTIYLTNSFKERLKFYLTNLEFLWDKNKNNPSLSGADTFPLIVLNLDQSDFTTYFPILEKYLTLWKNKFLKELPEFSTWMDTQKRKIAIEILSLYLKALRRFAKRNTIYIQEANELKKEIKKEILKNRKDINIIFSFLLLQDIFSLKEWEVIFDDLLKENYLDWGGLSTISKNDPNFKDEDDGELATAYHCGDSWYFLNNLLVYALEKINFKKYKNIIEKIFKASLDDLLIDGALGWSSEISSAKERRSEGSLVQLWSMSSLIFVLLKSEYLSQIAEQYS